MAHAGGRHQSTPLSLSRLCLAGSLQPNGCDCGFWIVLPPLQATGGCVDPRQSPIVQARRVPSSCPGPDHRWLNPQLLVWRVSTSRPHPSPQAVGGTGPAAVPGSISGPTAARGIPGCAAPNSDCQTAGYWPGRAQGPPLHYRCSPPPHPSFSLQGQGQEQQEWDIWPEQVGAQDCWPRTGGQPGNVYSGPAPQI